SDDSWRYRRGKVVSSDRDKLFGDVRLMRLPTLADLADKNFLANHCFKYAGVVDQNARVLEAVVREKILVGEIGKSWKAHEPDISKQLVSIAAHDLPTSVSPAVVT